MHNFKECFYISWCFSISVRKILSSVSQEGFGEALSGPLVRLLWDCLCREDDLPHLVSGIKHGQAEGFEPAWGCQSTARLSCLPQNGNLLPCWAACSLEQHRSPAEGLCPAHTSVAVPRGLVPRQPSSMCAFPVGSCTATHRCTPAAHLQSFGCLPPKMLATPHTGIATIYLQL